ncbi:hypothetical protein AMTRI_Chr01g114040 [Amborella trichopoda]
MSNVYALCFFLFNCKNSVNEIQITRENKRNIESLFEVEIMNLSSPKAFTGVSLLPRSVISLSIVIIVLALCLSLTSLLLIASPLGSAVHGYLLDINISSTVNTLSMPRNSRVPDKTADLTQETRNITQALEDGGKQIVYKGSEGDSIDHSSFSDSGKLSSGDYANSSYSVDVREGEGGLSVLGNNSGKKSSSNDSGKAKSLPYDAGNSLKANATEHWPSDSFNGSTNAGLRDFINGSITSGTGETKESPFIEQLGAGSSKDLVNEGSIENVNCSSSAIVVGTMGNKANESLVSGSLKDSAKVDMGKYANDSTFANSSVAMINQTEEPLSSVSNQSEKFDLGVCDLYHGKWVYDQTGPLYTNNTCPVITQMQNCQGNGRPDKEYENWRWKPHQCDLPHFDSKKFLELMRGKTLAFVGDSVARNQMESMMCILWQVETPRNRGSRKMQRWFFRSHSVTIVRIWSSWLVHQSSEPFSFAPAGIAKLHLDKPDETFMDFLPSFDVVVLSSGHWFAKQSAYILNNEILGGQLWWPDPSRPKKIDNVQAYGISVQTSLSSIAAHPNFTGVAIVRAYSPDHYEGGEWNTGGSCTGKVRPLRVGELVENLFTERMHAQQKEGFEKALKKGSHGASRLRFMDITEMFGYRPDGHPGPYRSPDPNKKTKRGPHGEPPPQDCLHWCMPGPIDTWNELVFEIIRREFEGIR